MNTHNIRKYLNQSEDGRVNFVDFEKSEAVRQEYKKERAKKPPLPKLPPFQIDKEKIYNDSAKIWYKIVGKIFFS